MVVHVSFVSMYLQGNCVHFATRTLGLITPDKVVGERNQESGGGIRSLLETLLPHRRPPYTAVGPTASKDRRCRQTCRTLRARTTTISLPSLDVNLRPLGHKFPLSSLMGYEDSFLGFAHGDPGGHGRRGGLARFCCTAEGVAHSPPTMAAPAPAPATDPNSAADAANESDSQEQQGDDDT
ncbi:hypothetical protein BCR44DRAFT_1245600 [Catenaria anguillulae PL171]|uniref:Uncharacterized protein n=1 Tax=Catenaria anguillulae PL171 TaxID=765915 RepID=A0A1Y2I1P8_9FUNG|nr:hypothetical protein BCR44DRAFT_1245600 [Catenaria anguillulae PL171]